MKHKKIVIPAAIIATAAAIAGTVYATGASASISGKTSSMASSLAQKLGIEESKVSEAMDSIETDRMSSQLDKAVSAGVITSEQKEKLLAKEKEIQEKQEALKTELEQWYSDNGIDESKLRQYGVAGLNGRGNMSGKGDRMAPPDIDTTDSSSNN